MHATVIYVHCTRKHSCLQGKRTFIGVKFKKPRMYDLWECMNWRSHQFEGPRAAFELLKVVLETINHTPSTWQDQASIKKKLDIKFYQYPTYDSSPLILWKVSKSRSGNTVADNQLKLPRTKDQTMKYITMSKTSIALCCFSIVVPLQ